MRLSTTLAAAVAELRSQLGRPFGRVAIVAPSPGGASLAQRCLGRDGPFVQVRVTFPEALLDGLGAPALLSGGLRPEPPGWLAATVLGALAARSDEARDLAQAQWASALASAVRKLEGAGVDGATLRAQARTEAEDPARVRLLADLLDRVAEARVASRLYGGAALARAARAAAEAPARSVGTDEAYVVLGDAALSPLEGAALDAWFAQRPGLRVATAPRAAPAQVGLQTAAAPYPIRTVRPEGSTALDSLRAAPTMDTAVEPSPSDPDLAARATDAAEGGRASSRPAAPDDGTVRMVQALDERREAREAVRHVLDGLAEGVPLDRIAIALPTAAQADLVWAELERAGVPFVSLVGPPMAGLPAAGLLRQLVAADPGRLSPAELLALLVHPELSRELVPTGLRRHRGRWRRLLAGLGPVRGLGAIAAGLAAPAEGAEASDSDPDAGARADLRVACERLGALLARRVARGAWGQHLGAWRDLVEAGLRRGEGKERLRQLLQGDGPGAHLSAADAAGLLDQELSARAILRGSLNDPAVRVLPPLELTAVDADLVVVCGLADGVFPQPPREDPLLPDAMVATLAAAGFRLEGSSVRETLERRRFAAAVGAARRRLVLSVPRSELMTGRPRQPGLLLLEAARALGWAETFGALSAVLRPSDTDAAGVTRDPARAVDGAEYRQAILTVHPDQGLGALAAHPFAPGLVRAHLALDAARDARARDAWRPCPFTGWIPPEVLPSPIVGETPVHPSVLERAVLEPLRHVVEDMLGARRPARFEDATSPLDKGTALRRLVRAIEDRLLEGAAPAVLWDELEAELADAGPLVQATLRGLRAEHPELERLPDVVDVLGVPVQGQGALRAGERTLLELRTNARSFNKGKFDPVKAFRIGALALGCDPGRGDPPGVDEAVVTHVEKGTVGRYPRTEVAPTMEALLTVHLERIRLGGFFATRPADSRWGPPLYALRGEPELDAKKDLEPVRAWLGEEGEG